MNQNQSNNKDFTPQQPGSKKTPPRSNAYVAVWVVIFIILGILLFFKDHNNIQSREITQSQFEKFVFEDNAIATARLTPDGDGIFKVEGDIFIGFLGN